jgi:SAM-dependent methyltransferase
VDIDTKQQWQDAFPAYKALIRDPEFDSEYLRRTGLLPNMIDLIGDVRDAHVLDAGCGTGWLFDSITPLSGHECDLIAPVPRGTGAIRSQCQDVRALTYDDDSFDLVVSSLVLMWVDDLAGALREAYRVTRPGGRLIVAIMHPYFHTNGHTLTDGSFLIDRSLARPAERAVLISGVVGPLTYYFRPLIDYYNAALQSRWRLARFRDHFIDMDRYRTEAAERRAFARRTDKVPLFTFFECHKGSRDGIGAG